MITSELMGGIGNMMFQISASISLAIDNDDKSVFDLSSHKINLQGFNAVKYKNNILSKIEDSIVNTKNVYREPFFNYNVIPYQKDLKIIGYFQCEKYFENNTEVIKKLFSPTIDITVKLKQFISLTNNKNKSTVSLHIRRGDYLRFPDIHPFVGVNYINKSISMFTDSIIYVVSDDIDWCKKNVSPINNNIIYFVENNLDDYELLYLMSLCDNNIISNSSFSWWGSYLNSNERKIVIAPKNWFGKSFNNDFNDVYTNNMIII